MLEMVEYGLLGVSLLIVIVLVATSPRGNRPDSNDHE